MAEQLVDPPHIRQAKAALAAAGIPVEAGEAALALASRFYHETTQHSRTDALRKDRNRTQDELERVSTQLQQARRDLATLTQEVTQLRAVAAGAPSPHEQQLRGRLRRLRRQLHALHSLLASPQRPAAEVVALALAAVKQLVASEHAGPDPRDIAAGEELLPIVVVQGAPSPPVVKKIKKQRKAGTALEHTQRQRLGELEGILSRRTQFERLGERLLTRLAGMQSIPRAEQLALAGDNARLLDVLQQWNGICGTVHNLLAEGVQPPGHAG